jgi:hypothetical protein
MITNDESKEKLIAQMEKIISEYAKVASGEAKTRALEEQKSMEREVINYKEQLRARLKEHIIKELQDARPSFQTPSYKGYIDRVEEKLFKLFQTYAGKGSRKEKLIDQTYPRFERNLLSDFLSAVPNATGHFSARAKDLIENCLIHTFKTASLQLPENTTNYLLTAFQEAFRIYAGLSKIGLNNDAEKKYEELERAILSNLQAHLLKQQNTQAESKLRSYLDSTLENAELGLTNYQTRNIEDQILWLFMDYIQAPEEERDEVYVRGEERIIISAFDPAGQNQATGSAA